LNEIVSLPIAPTIRNDVASLKRFTYDAWARQNPVWVLMLAATSGSLDDVFLFRNASASSDPKSANLMVECLPRSRSRIAW